MLIGANRVVIAIDGPAASGKSTVARRVAAELGFIYVDSGSLYRGMTWFALIKKVPLNLVDEVVELMNKAQWDFFVRDGAVGFRIDGLEPGQELRSALVADNVSAVAAIPAVRVFISERLREMVRFGSLVVEGRDIGSVVFPQTPHKFYLEATAEARAQRRQKDMAQIGEQFAVQQVQASLNKRDAQDSGRKTAPLQVAPGAEVVDTTALGIDEVVALVIQKYRGT